MRLPNWATRLGHELESMRVSGHRYGVSDCYMLPARCLRAMSGQEILPIEGISYNSMSAAHAIMRSLGHGSPLDGLTAAFDEKLDRMDAKLAMPGDVCLIRTGKRVAAGIRVVSGVVVMSRGGLQVEWPPTTCWRLP